MSGRLDGVPRVVYSGVYREVYIPSIYQGGHREVYTTLIYPPREVIMEG